jgi:hypothetical protein
VSLEASVQARVRLEIARRGWHAWRNNVGTLLDSRGVPVRFGLANDSKAVNSNVKSGDLIGIIPRVITPQDVGTVIGQFASWECKREGWRPSPTDDHEQAQMRWAELVLLAGGHAAFVTSPDQL